MEIGNAIAAILAGFSIVAAIILLVLYGFFLPLMRKTRFSKLICSFILGGLAVLQSAHFYYFFSGHDILLSRAYVGLLMALPLSFYLFSSLVLFQVKARKLLLLHFLPLPLSFFLPAALVSTLSYVLGTCYTVWLASRIYALRAERARFKVEIVFFSMFSVMAVTALVLGLFLPFISHAWFYIVYSSTIAFAMIAVMSALLIFPELLEDVIAIAESTYVSTKLQGVDEKAKLEQLSCLLEQDKLFTNEDLKLAQMAEMLALSVHQLSELINTHYAKNFPRLIRECRIEAAKKQLLAEPTASMLVISIETGFKSQSAFYTAFKEITGIPPGLYRKQYLPH